MKTKIRSLAEIVCVLVSCFQVLKGIQSQSPLLTELRVGKSHLMRVESGPSQRLSKHMQEIVWPFTLLIFHFVKLVVPRDSSTDTLSLDTTRVQINNFEDLKLDIV